MKKKYFGTDGIRGTVNQGNINGEKFFKFGLAAGTYFTNQRKTKQIHATSMIGMAPPRIQVRAQNYTNASICCPKP